MNQFKNTMTITVPITGTMWCMMEVDDRRVGGEIQMQVLQFLRDVNRAAQLRNVLPDPIAR